MNILLPTDFSKLSDSTIVYSLDSFIGRTCTFYLLNLSKVLDYTTPNLFTASPRESLYDSLLHQKKVKLEKLQRHLEKTYAQEQFEIHLLTGHDIFSNAVTKVVKINEIDLICMGTNGISGFQEFILGTHTLRVARQSNCPVMIIPENFIFKEYRSMMLTLDYNQRFKTKFVNQIFKIIGNKNIKCTFLRMPLNENTLEEDRELNEMRASVGNNLLEIKKINGISTKGAIDTYLKNSDFDLNVLIVKKELFLKRILSGSELPKIIKSTKVPLLLVPEE